MYRDMVLHSLPGRYKGLGGSYRLYPQGSKPLTHIIFLP